MSFPSSQRLVWWRLALAALALGAGSCGNDTPDDGAAASTRTTVAFEAPVHLGVNAVALDAAPRIAVGQEHTWVTIWPTSVGVRAQRSTDGGTTWGAPIVIDDTQPGLAPDLACDRHGVCVALWVIMNPDDGEIDVVVARSADDGATWGASSNLGRPHVYEGFAGGASIATDGRGTWVIVWDAVDVPGEGTAFSAFGRIEAVTSSDGGVTWGAPQAVDLPADGIGQYNSRIVADGTGHFVATFNIYSGDADHPGFFNRVAAVRSGDGHTWSESVLVGALDPRNNSNREANGELGTDGAGTWHVVWTAHRIDETGRGNFQELLTARSVDGGATWSVPQQLDAPGASTVDLNSTLAADVDGHVVVVWLSSLEANRMQLLTVQSADAGVSWSAPSDFPGGAANPLLDGFPDVDLATDHRGAWTAVWSLASLGAQTIYEPRDVVVACGATRYATGVTSTATATVCSPPPRMTPLTGLTSP
jgi:BNR repeat protein